MAFSIIPLIVFIFVIILILCGFVFPKSKNTALKYITDYGTAPLLGCLILLVTLTINFDVVIRGIAGSRQIQPFSILILFMALAYICISIDRTGFFEYLALRAAKGAGHSGKRLFMYFFFTISLVTIFTSNDIVILTFTPIICYFAKYTKINPVPFIIGQFFAANIWSIMLFIGNPTNIIVAEAFNLSFIEYSTWMFFPTLMAGISAFLLLYLLFRKEIPNFFETPAMDPKTAIKDKFGSIFGVGCLVTCLILLTFASWLNLELWMITLIFALIMLVRDSIHDIFRKRNKILGREPVIPYITQRMPWKIIPFMLGMFILVESLIYTGWLDLFASLFLIGSSSVIISVLLMGFLTALSCNVMNNQPMTILFTSTLLSSTLVISEPVKLGNMFSLIMGSNFGANFTLIGALAGIMWYKILQNQEVNISYKSFSKYGVIIMPIVMLLAYGILILELLLWL